MTAAREEDWLWGWDDTPGIVSVHADAEGRALVWRRIPGSGALVRDEERYRPWLLLDRLDDLAHLGAGLAREGDAGAGAAVRYRELDGPGALRFLVSANDGTLLTRALLRGASERLGRRCRTSVSCPSTPCSPCPRTSSTWWRRDAPTSAASPSTSCIASSSTSRPPGSTRATAGSS